MKRGRIQEYLKKRLKIEKLSRREGEKK